MSIKMTPQEKGSVVIVDIKGRLVLGEGTCALRDKMHDLIARGCTRILLNLAETSYMDSSAVGELVAAHAAVTDAGGTIKLMNLSKRVHSLLKITRLHMVFEIFDDEASAIASFAPPVQTELQAKYASLFQRFTNRYPYHSVGQGNSARH